MGTGSSKNNNVVAFDVENVPPAKKQNDQNGNKPSSWQEDVKKEQKSRSRLGVIIFSSYFKYKYIVGIEITCHIFEIYRKGVEMQFVNCSVNTIGLQLTQIAKWSQLELSKNKQLFLAVNKLTRISKEKQYSAYVGAYEADDNSNTNY